MSKNGTCKKVVYLLYDLIAHSKDKTEMMPPRQGCGLGRTVEIDRRRLLEWETLPPRMPLNIIIDVYMQCTRMRPTRINNL